ncbi:glycosyltransferase [Pseudochelatococcus lubricantis]|uniref:glycosyltransferase n=1 Tax=Pseudochelatococcus lubricantis TaxID=1538102 RepID=UPI0035EDA496
MKILFVHQNFPGQFAGLVDHLIASGDHEVAAIGARQFQDPRILYRNYAAPPAGSAQNPLQDEAAVRISRAEAVAAQARILRLNGFAPDVILAHTGWSESLFLRDIFPEAKLVCYCEYHYMRRGGDVGFDPEFPVESLDTLHRLRIRNAFELSAIDDADACISPTPWQRSTYPSSVRPRIEVIHEGIDADTLAAVGGGNGHDYAWPAGIGTDTPVVTYVARYLEPQRGFHTFMRALPSLQAAVPDVHTVIVGADQGGYGPPPAERETWKETMLTELGERVDLTRVHFAGRVSYRDYATILKRSDVHAYLTYPFVLSWSALEAMAMGKAIVASDTPPVRDFMTDGENARLVDFFDSRALADTVATLLNTRDERNRLGAAARQFILSNDLTRQAACKKVLDFIRSL